MNLETNNPKPFPGVIETISVLFCAAIISQCLFFNLAFSGFWTVVPIGVLATGLGVAAGVRRRIWQAVVLGVIALVIAAINLPTVPRMFPLRQRAPAASFEDARVADVLYHLARSKDDRPYWRFNVAEKELGDVRVDLTIPAGASLGEALEAVMTEAGASYRWGWHKHCGNEPFPLVASFYVSRDGVGADGDFEMLISSHGILE